MLVLTRERNQKIMIGDDIEITIADIREGKVRVGINAPRHVPVQRLELYAREKRSSAPASSDPSA